MKGLRTVRIVMAAALVTLGASNVSAQVLGPFTWQMQPFCNIVRLTLTSTPIGFTADGTDDQCGGASLASAVGVANFNAFGLVVINFTIVTPPSGKPVHVSAAINTGNGNGTWTDSVGNSGTFAFAAATPALPPRPLPASGVAPAIDHGRWRLRPTAVGRSEIADRMRVGRHRRSRPVSVSADELDRDYSALATSRRPSAAGANGSAAVQSALAGRAGRSAAATTSQLISDDVVVRLCGQRRQRLAGVRVERRRRRQHLHCARLLPGSERRAVATTASARVRGGRRHRPAPSDATVDTSTEFAADRAGARE